MLLALHHLLPGLAVYPSTCPAQSSFRVALHPVWLLILAKGFFEAMSFGNTEANQFAQHVINFMSRAFAI
jgi:hypothetical protein